MPDPPLTEKEKFKLKIIKETSEGKRTNDEAAKLLSLSVRQVKRLKKKVKREGEKAVIHTLKNKVGNHQIDTTLKQQILSLFKQNYVDFKPSFASEKLLENHGLKVNPETLRLWLATEGLWKVKRQKPVAYHAFRERLQYFGELEQFDGSYHYWFEKRLIDNSGNPVEVCLLASIDDATGAITHAKFDFNEGITAVFTFWKQYVETQGKPLKIYLDKFSTYKINHKAAVDNTELMTQFQQVTRILNIELIHANSPQAKGRIERLFQTLQDRLVKELRLAEINTLEDGNKFLKEVFIPQFNAKFSVQAEKTGDLHRELTKGERENANNIFSIKQTRRVNNDFTIQFKNHFYQLEEIQPLTIRPKDIVTIEIHLDASIHFEFKSTYLNFFLLPQKPEKQAKQPVILTNHPLHFKPPENHPWRKFKIKP
jgi:transposase